MFHRMYKKGAEVLEDFLQRTDGWGGKQDKMPHASLQHVITQ